MSVPPDPVGTSLLARSLSGLLWSSSRIQTITLITIGTCLPGITSIVNAQSQETYYDDTYEILNSDVPREEISGEFGYDSYQFSGDNDDKPLALDLRDAVFTVANSRNSWPTTEFDCDYGSLPVNKYPLKIYGPDITSVIGGYFESEVPLESDWAPTYCNSAAIIFKDSPSSEVDGVRLMGAWDGIRPGRNSVNLTIRNSWISNVRDDAVENDSYFSLVFEDNLVDGAFQGISVHSGGDVLGTSQETVYVLGNVIKIKEYLYKGGQRFGALFKNEDTSPNSVIRDTVVAVEYFGGATFGRYWDRSWSKISDCSNNLFLWLSDEPIPDSVPAPPACFKVLSGAEAMAAWQQAKQNWIDCHPRVPRASDDPESVPEQCTPGTYGGYSRNSAKRPLPPELESAT